MPLLCRYRIHVFAKDSTGDMQLILGDREVRTIVGMRARELVTQVQTNTSISFTELDL